MKKNKIFIFLFIIIFSIKIISSECNDGQIDINYASLEELDTLVGIGPIKAQEIINSRTYSSLEDLLNVKGIGKVTLENIKKQGIACVEKKTEDKINERVGRSSDEEEFKTKIIKITPIKEKTTETKNQKVSTLNAQNIKSKDTNKKLTFNWALHGVIFFCVVFGALVLLKNRRYKNEFQ
jgi:competence ComEA-like helix-hairpin-helix protein